MLSRLARRLRNAFATPVPPAFAVCEFNCHKASCMQREWAACARRLGTQRLAAEAVPLGNRSRLAPRYHGVAGIQITARDPLEPLLN